jgi:hypothetical protein
MIEIKELKIIKRDNVIAVKLIFYDKDNKVYKGIIKPIYVLQNKK